MTFEMLNERHHAGQGDDDFSSVIGVKNKSVHVNAGSKIAKRIEPTLLDMVKTSYEKIGGNPKVQYLGDLGDEYPNWVVADVDEDPDVDCLVAGKTTPAGPKMAASATDGSPAAKATVMSIKKQLYKNGWWGEVSDAPAHIALNKLGIKPVEDEKKVRALLGGKEITWHGEHPEGKFPGTHGWYSRDIGGTVHAKIIVGDV